MSRWSLSSCLWNVDVQNVYFWWAFKQLNEFHSRIFGLGISMWQRITPEGPISRFSAALNHITWSQNFTFKSEVKANAYSICISAELKFYYITPSLWLTLYFPKLHLLCVNRLKQYLTVLHERLIKGWLLRTLCLITLSLKYFLRNCVVEKLCVVQGSIPEGAVCVLRAGVFSPV